MRKRKEIESKTKLVVALKINDDLVMLVKRKRREVSFVNNNRQTQYKSTCPHVQSFDLHIWINNHTIGVDSIFGKNKRCKLISFLVAFIAMQISNRALYELTEEKY